jgi:hypothetical protein
MKEHDVDAEADRLILDDIINDPFARLGMNSSRNSKGTGHSAKDEIRRILGTYHDDGTLPEYTIEELARMTKKSEINIRTMLSDLRSTKYCGREGVFLTERIKRPDGKISFSYIPPSAYKNAKTLCKDVPGLGGTEDNAHHDGRGDPVKLEKMPFIPAGKVVECKKPLLPLLPAEMLANIAEASEATRKQLKREADIADKFAKAGRKSTSKKKVPLDESILDGLS